MEPAGRSRGLVELSAVPGAAALVPIAAVDPDAARRSAQDILDGSKYQEQQFPRPFKGVLEWIADRLRPVAEAIDDVTAPVVDAFLALPGGRFILAAVVVAGLALLVRWMIGRRSRAAVHRAGGSGLVDLRADPDRLEQEADDAEAAGDHALAVRRRYEAGLLRLVRADRLTLRPDTTAGAAARQVSSPVMDQLTADFEAIVYGGRPAGADDVRSARTGWAELVGAGARR